MLRKNLYIEILKKSHQKNEFTLREIFDDLKLNSDEHYILKQSRDSGLLFQETGRKKNDENRESLYTISIKGLSILIDHENSEEAKKLSKKAIYIAIVSIVISSILIIIQIFISLNN